MGDPRSPIRKINFHRYFLAIIPRNLWMPVPALVYISPCPKMPNIDPTPALKLQPDLLAGESIYWAGMPSPGKIFHSDDLVLIPFGKPRAARLHSSSPLGIFISPKRGHFNRAKRGDILKEV